MFDTVELHELVTYFWYLLFMHGWFANIFSQYVSPSFQSLSHVWLFVSPWTTAHQASLPITNSQSFLKLLSIGLVMPSNHLILCRPFSSRLQSFPALGSFQMSQFFASDGQSFAVSASASVFPVNIQDWFPLGWTGWISLLPKGFSRVFSNTTVQKHNSSVLSFLYSLTLTSIHDYWMQVLFNFIDSFFYLCRSFTFCIVLLLIFLLLCF